MRNLEFGIQPSHEFCGVWPVGDTPTLVISNDHDIAALRTHLNDEFNINFDVEIFHIACIYTRYICRFRDYDIDREDISIYAYTVLFLVLLLLLAQILCNLPVVFL